MVEDLSLAECKRTLTTSGKAVSVEATAEATLSRDKQIATG